MERVFPIKPGTRMPEFASEVLIKKGKEEVAIVTPSGQWWNALSPSRQKLWRDTVQQLGADPEDYLAQMRSMFPKSPKGAE
ncbi:hypothetical protein LCGC14_0880440 [marine sediment metagenome]|uniref:Uncharacterized protein n=1 Tax=marine sediment metagenome TaxID=412755 RepID=A0A0F9PMP9_9ZZZZ